MEYIGGNPLKRVLINLVVVFAFAAPGSVVLAQTGPGFEQSDRQVQRRGGRGGIPHGRRLERALEHVELPQEVRDDIDDLLDASHRNQRKLKRDVRKANQRMRELLSAEEPDEKSIMTEVETIGSIKTEMQKDRLLTLLRIRGRLSLEQRDALTRFMQSQRGKARKGRKQRAGRDGAARGEAAPRQSGKALQ